MNTELTIRILIPAVAAFVIGMASTPFFTYFFYKYKLWKKKSRVDSDNSAQMSKESATSMDIVHNDVETRTPRVGGVIVWFTIILVGILGYIFSHYFPNSVDLDFITRNQTFIPFASLIVGAALGLVDDLLQIFGNSSQLEQGIPRRVRIIFVGLLGIFVGLWFYIKLSYSSVALPFDLGIINLGVLFVPFFALTFLSLFSSSVIDGIDGLASGVLAIIFSTYGVIGIVQEQHSIAIFSFVVTGALLAFLWFNVPPARFFLGESGILALTLPLAVLIFLTNTVVEFLIIGLPLVITSASSLVQIISLRLFKKRIFKIAPFHHHLELLGWSRERITMRYWIFSALCSATGMIIVIVG